MAAGAPELISVVIVTFNSEDWIETCLDALAAQTDRDYEIVVVDNASEDATVEHIRARNQNGLKLLQLDENTGFAAGCNRGVEKAAGQWIAFLNPDTMAAPDWIEQARAGFARYSSISVFTSAQFNFDDPDSLDGVGDAYLGYGFPWRGGYGRPASELPAEGECFSPCGAAMFIRKDLFDAYAGFEESFFCYCEDVDLGFRLRRGGEKTILLPDARVAHKSGATSDTLPGFAIYHGTRNRIWTYVRNMPLALLVLTLPMHVLITFYLLARAIGSALWSPVSRGVWDGLKGVPAAFAARKDLTHRGSVFELVRQMDWNPFRLPAHHVSVRMYRKK